MSKDARQVAIERQLENDEPKCANCAHWKRFREGASFGKCAANSHEHPEDGIFHIAESPDLAICSQWGPK